MSFATIKQQLYNWFVQQSGFQAGNVIFDLQGGPRPLRPYATIHVASGSRKIGARDDLMMNGQTVSIAGMRELTCSINVFGVNAVETLSSLKDTLELPGVFETFLENNMSVTDASDVRDLSELEDTGWQQRAQMDLTVQYTVQVTDTSTSTIEHTTVTLTGSDLSGPSVTNQVN